MIAAAQATRFAGLADLALTQRRRAGAGAQRRQISRQAIDQQRSTQRHVVVLETLGRLRSTNDR